MCDQDYFEQDRLEYEARGLVTRRQFGMLLGAGVAMVLPRTLNAVAVAVTEAEVVIQTPDGMADCYFVHPQTGRAAAVIVWPDIRGLRPAFRQMGKRLAEVGYSVLVVNPFYRLSKAPGARPGASIEELRPLALPLNATTASTDARAFVSWLDQQPSVATHRKIGVHGYCLGGDLAFLSAAANTDRIAAVGSFHGGRLVTTGADSPHLIAARSKAQFLVAIAENDDMRAPAEKAVLRDTFAKANLYAEIEVYTAAHGWCPPDSQVYNEAQAERAWSRLLALYEKALA